MINFIYYPAPVIIYNWSLIFQILGYLTQFFNYMLHVLHFLATNCTILPFAFPISPFHSLHIIWFVFLASICDPQNEPFHLSHLHIVSDLPFLDPNFTISWSFFHPRLHIFPDLPFVVPTLTIFSPYMLTISVICYHILPDLPFLALNLTISLPHLTLLLSPHITLFVLCGT